MLTSFARHNLVDPWPLAEDTEEVGFANAPDIELLRITLWVTNVGEARRSNARSCGEWHYFHHSAPQESMYSMMQARSLLQV